METSQQSELTARADAGQPVKAGVVNMGFDLPALLDSHSLNYSANRK